jgi:hypothetical protein
MSMMKVALTGWFSFRDGEVTAGDLLALDSVRLAAEAAQVPYETFWSPGFRAGGPSLDSLPVPAPHSHMVFVCGPLHGEQIARLHKIFAASRRIAAGVSVIDPDDPVVTGFDRILARDAPGAPVTADLSVSAPLSPTPPVTAVVLTGGQGEYGSRRRHGQVAAAVTARLAERDAALVPLDTRASAGDWALPSTAAQFEAVVRRMDLVVTNRLHGLALALRRGVPVLAVDPVDGGAKLSAQARVWDWPAVLTPSEVESDAFDHWWSWCLGEGRGVAGDRRQHPPRAGADAMTAALIDMLGW